MLTREYRLRKMKDWKILFDKGQFFGGDFITLKVWEIDPKEYPRGGYGCDGLKIGFAVGLKVSKRAVKRNRIKRQMREVVRLLVKDHKVKKGYFVGVLAKPNILNKEYIEIEQELVKIFKKAKLLI